MPPSPSGGTVTVVVDPAAIDDVVVAAREVDVVPAIDEVELALDEVPGVDVPVARGVVVTVSSLDDPHPVARKVMAASAEKASLAIDRCMVRPSSVGVTLIVVGARRGRKGRRSSSDISERDRRRRMGHG
jgi:hypothetical protein